VAPRKAHGQTKEAAMNQCEVKLYALSTCSHCRDTKDLLDQCKIEYECIEVDRLNPEDRKKALEEVKKLNPQCTFPTLEIGNNVIVGFKKDQIKEALNVK
jgi:glutaredoxin-like protein NrdH